MTKSLCSLLPDHDVVHVHSLGWDRDRNGELIRAAEQQGFQVLVTNDKNMVYQQNNAERSISLLVLSTNRRRIVRAAREDILSAIQSSLPGSFRYLELS